MKKIFIISVCLLCLCGCNKNNRTINNTNKDDTSSTYTFCYMYTKNMNISKSIYYNKDYIVYKDLELMDIKYDTLSEAVEVEEEQKEKLKNTKSNSECSVERTNNIVSINCETKMPQYTYKEKITQLESEGYKCSEEDTND